MILSIIGINLLYYVLYKFLDLKLKLKELSIPAKILSSCIKWSVFNSI